MIVEFIKDFANYKVGDFFDCSEDIANMLINQEQVAIEKVEKIVKKKVTK
ncbi:hypothetical protein UFOVP104_49 [uncultured Caudovirales phage]|uniref:Uncharacterized protein n=1 Tax=uncultured Caudovirales phage TaxID=2100421 RepID=A0A6J5L796_9CAUD|nr:hypothetical protein UFOVP104_49 [uncultured Caudovirales phage]CAB4134200.1 hypothetical protein UFOVP271_29 [uncultured Caudovirales phage]